RVPAVVVPVVPDGERHAVHHVGEELPRQVLALLLPGDPGRGVAPLVGEDRQVLFAFGRAAGDEGAQALVVAGGGLRRIAAVRVRADTVHELQQALREAALEEGEIHAGGGGGDDHGMRVGAAY